MKKMTFLWGTMLLILLVFTAGTLKTKDNFRKNKFALEQSTPVNISRSGSDSDYPLIGLDGNGAAYVIWIEHEGIRNIYFATSKSGSWSNPQRVIDIRSGSEEAGFPSFDTLPSGICHLTFHDVRTDYYDVFHMAYANNWGQVTNISETEGGSAYSACAANPADNYLFAVWMDGVSLEWELFMRYRTNTGSWGSLQTLPVGTGYMPALAIDRNGTAHLVWFTRGGGNATVWYSRNSNPRELGQWTQPVVVRGSTSFEWCMSKVACDNAGNAYVVWIDRTQGNQEIFFRKRNAYTGSWEAEVNVSQTGGVSDEPAVAVNKENGNVFVAWSEQTGGQWDIFLNSYTGSWSGASNMSNNAAASKMPNLAIDFSGRIHLVYADVEPGNFEIMYIGTAQLPPSVQKPYPPLDLALDTQLDASQTKKINTITWNRNPQNNNFNIINYKVYRKGYEQGDSAFQTIATVSGSTYQYENIDLPFNQKYTYACTSVSQEGKESDLSASITEETTFPPMNITLTTVTNSSLFQDEKINVIAWQKNPLNEAITVASYNIYRKKIEQSDSQYQRLATLEADKLEYQDRKLSFSEKYSYVLTTVDAGGYESKRSISVKEN